MRVVRCGVLGAMSVMIAACGERPPLCPDAHFDGEVPVAATSTTMPSFLRVTAHTTSDEGGIGVDIVDGRGTVSYEGRGPIPAFIFEEIPWGLIDRTLYAGLGILDGVWYPFWLYCTDDGQLTDFDGEMTDRDVAVLSSVHGTCVPSAPLAGGGLDLPAHTLRNVALSCGYTVTGAPGQLPIDLGSSRAGTALAAGHAATVLPFHTVDCRENCGTPGWYELHAIVFDPSTQWAAFGVFYLDESKFVLAGNGVQLPAASDFGEFYQGATWTLAR